MNKNDEQPEINRRDFLRNTSQAAFMAWMGGVELRAEDSPKSTGGADTLTKIPDRKVVHFGVIGAGTWGREIITTLEKLTNVGEPPVQYAPVIAICENYQRSLDRAGNLAPKAKLLLDYKELLAMKEVEAVIVATPTHLHREIVLAALEAGKHVYCEAPLANTIDDAKAIAQAAQKHFKQLFQAGLQERSHPQREFLWPFIHARNLGRNLMARVQWHKKTSWAQDVTDPLRTANLNWRLQQKTSSGLIGETCIHLLDAATWFMEGWPTEVTGFSSMILWGNDHNRDVPDTVQAIFEMPEGARIICDATICNSFEAQYEMYYGSDNSILVRDNQAWMFMEPDAPNVGWVVYCRRDTFGHESGVVLEANGSKQKSLLKDAVAAPAFPFPSIHYALDNFHLNVCTVRDAVEDFSSTYPDGKAKEFQDYLAPLGLKPAAGSQTGFRATVLAIKANEATLARQKIALPKELFEL